MPKKLLVASLVSAVLLAGCGETTNTQQNAPAPLVQTQAVEVVPHQQSKIYIGRMDAVEDTAITAQVSGYLLERHFQEGQIVEKGQLLYTIEPSTFEAQVASAKAMVSEARSSLKKAELDFERGKNLVKSNNISQAEFDALTASLMSARAQLEAGIAQEKVAEVNLSHTTIRAPFTGRISDSKVSTGDLLSPSSGVLTTLVSMDPIYASFSISERERLALGMDQIEGDGSDESNGVAVNVILEDGRVYEQQGKIDFLGNRINLNTGTLAMRAVVENPSQRLLPGQHVRVELMEKEASDVVTVPRRAVQTDLEGDFVMIVSEGNVAERRNVALGPQVETGVVIRSGLKTTDVVITQGLQRVRNGIPVRIQEPKSQEQGA
ncbi:efflux RND transporter periplasmic adaptor subunit [Vibrio mediterranei]|uniref:Efflux RND transporter periplasmic adaptor subunit n=1 Tax=Vibrio mediterranei TaxID=689 RepID=A0A241TBV3_9VIBR|nr:MULTISPECIES: efflux RND transporter periplasmic adaptor subunit [Vibrio]ASI92642.1 efflux transporter periplasmic adaptor subunit [Vibrio mediterranei]AYV24682.1 efflux RND transporter periplasmic adaptor subunit [Vibrio mediterranei]EDL52380.1 putative multidrug efflux membrane fusion protein [Vibrio mediterranei AK1]MCF4175875.1 efflux RND transporter periplasmic adaptor subunit [Vibrio sp. McD22-P3]MCG9788717.1 efflux RND transporter periplasmic adaptor subunit [Vibrio mediterranei]